jgi:hypothetical protein
MNGLEIITKRFEWLERNGKVFLELECPASMRNTIREFVLGLVDRQYSVTVKEHKEKRTKDQNSYLWTLINELANVLRISKEECYLKMLKRYGQMQVIKVVTEGLPILLRAVKYYDIISEDEHCTFVKVYMGSSEMNTREMSILIDGVISDCKEQGIQTDTPEELARLKKEWEKEE